MAQTKEQAWRDTQETWWFVSRQGKANMAEMQGVLAQLEEFGTKTVHLGATHRFRRTGSDMGNPHVPGGTTRLAKVDDHDSDLETNKPSLDVVLSE